MPETGYLLAAVGVAVALTWALRALPFAALAPLRSSSLVAYLATALPVGALTILACYTLRDFNVGVPSQAWPTALALACTVALHLCRSNAVLSILGGTPRCASSSSLRSAPDQPATTLNAAALEAPPAKNGVARQRPACHGGTTQHTRREGTFQRANGDYRRGFTGRFGPGARHHLIRRPLPASKPRTGSM